VESKPLAAIDIGTNTFRLLIANILYNPKTNKYKIREIFSERTITRLGQGISEKGIIKKLAIAKSSAVLRKYSDIISQHNVQAVSAVATSALREAGNRKEFIKKVKETSGLKIKIISGREEARKTSLGVLAGIVSLKAALIADIGGGSTELIFIRNGKPVIARSLNLGVVHLADEYMKNDPPLKRDLTLMEKRIDQKIMPAVKSFSELIFENPVFIGTAGTITALAAIAQNLKKFDHSKVHCFRLGIKKIRNIFSAISTITARERVKCHPFEPERLDIIVPGTLILIKLMQTFDFKGVIVSNYGLREGILLDLYQTLEKYKTSGYKKEKKGLKNANEKNIQKT
jgi:exopolyphosphatase/guanosine-5'-triphosphate,3'-diphosphate pyrophosphatase